MKKIYLSLLIALLCIGAVSAQAPLKFNYQAVLRDNAGQVIPTENVLVKIEILLDAADGTVVFEEEHNTQTNEFGLINLVIGSVNSLETIDWNQNAYFIGISVDGQFMGASQLLSVPFALHAYSSADAFSGDYNDLANTPDLTAFIAIEEPQEGDLLVFKNQQWSRLPIGEEGQVLTIVNGTIQWADLPEGDNQTVTDIDGNVYQTVTIAGITWMAENLRTTKYNDGTPIPTGLDNEEWGSTLEGAHATYDWTLVEGIDSEVEMAQAYGRLYNWYAVGDERGLCPAGWRVPNQSDFTAVVNYLIEGDEDITVLNVGNALKSCRQINSPLEGECATTVHPRWNEMATQYGTDLVGFSALPAGLRSIAGTYLSLGMQSHTWTADENPDDETQAYHRFLNLFSGSVAGGFGISKNAGYSVRCIKDTP